MAKPCLRYLDLAVYHGRSQFIFQACHVVNNHLHVRRLVCFDAYPEAKSLVRPHLPLLWYIQVLANLRQDDTLFSARRAVRLLGTYCDLPLFTDAILSSLENRPPRPPPPPPPGRRSTDDSLRLRQRPPAIDQKEQHAGDSLASTIIGRGLGDDDDRNLQRDDSDGLYRQRCLQWLRPRLPLAWLLNQALLGRVPSISPAADASSSKEAATAAAEAGAVEEIGQDPHRPGHGVAGNGRGEEQKTFMRRGLALSLVSPLHSCRAISLAGLPLHSQGITAVISTPRKRYRNTLVIEALSQGCASFVVDRTCLIRIMVR